MPKPEFEKNEMDRITTKTVQDDSSNDVIIVYLDGEDVFRWHDNAQCDYPEDLCWHRMISDVFYSGIEIGRKLEATKKIRAEASRIEQEKL